MKTLIVHFSSGKFLSLSMPDETADKSIVALNVGAEGTTLITGDNGNSYLINRAHMTHVTVEP